MAIHRFQREVAIAASRERVFAELAEPARFVGLQPLLVDVREIDAPRGVRAFEAIERVPLFGPFAATHRLRVELMPLDRRHRIEFATRAPLGIRLLGAFDLDGDERTTRVRESVVLHCPRLLGRFVQREAMRAQEALLANLKQRLEAAAR